MKSDQNDKTIPYIISRKLRFNEIKMKSNRWCEKIPFSFLLFMAVKEMNNPAAMHANDILQYLLPYYQMHSPLERPKKQQKKHFSVKSSFLKVVRILEWYKSSKQQRSKGMHGHVELHFMSSFLLQLLTATHFPEA